MFLLRIESTTPGADERLRAHSLLAGVLDVQALLRIGDLQRAERILRAQVQRSSRARMRMLAADQRAVEERLKAHAAVRRDPQPRAQACLSALLHHVGGVFTMLEMGDRVVAARVRAPRHADSEVRILLLPREARNMRVCVQWVAPPATAATAPAPRCYGSVGDAYILQALDAMALDALFLAVLAYLHTN